MSTFYQKTEPETMQIQLVQSEGMLGNYIFVSKKAVGEQLIIS